MDWAQLLVTFLGILLGSGLIQFFINRKDDKENRIKQIQRELRKEIDEKEKRNEQHYLEHKEEIQKLNEIIVQLSENDAKQSEYMKHIGNELVGLAHDRLVCLTDKFQDRGGITLKEKATLKAIFEPYHNGLGGNGDGQAGYEYCMSLPVIAEEEAKALDKKI